jgi:hypothetical protein
MSIVREVPFLSKSECVSIVEEIKSLREIWTCRNRYYDGTVISSSVPEFYTLGTAAYLDGPSAHLNNSNDMMYAHFSKILHKLINILERELKVKVFIDPKYSYPGFHIFVGNEELPYGAEYGGGLHIDIPHLTSKFPFEFDETRPLSITLALEMPKLGGGLNYWSNIEDLASYYKDATGLPIPPGFLYSDMPSKFVHLMNSRRKYVKYTEGTLYIHNGQTLHQLANEVPTSHDDLRVTLQAHGVYREKGLMIYL